MDETYESPLSNTRKVVQTANDAVVIAVTAVSFVSLIILVKDITEETSAKIRHRKANKKK